MIADFTSTDWGKVYKAKDSLLQIGASAIPDLIKLFDNPKSFAKLEGTADLIYPGATEFWGHGWIVDYDIDWIAIRVGWALEDLTFQNFGFSENVITERELMNLHKKDYAKYIETGKHDISFQKQKFNELDQIIEKAKRWWRKNQKHWTPLQALKDAVFSNDLERQMNAIHQMRFPNYTIKDLTQEWFDKNLKKRIEELNKSRNEDLVLQIEYLLRDGVSSEK
ncbi:hypothetical protein M0G43_14040 [Subsaxibacter sp. CAU 1640]|uniref:hypothetical protein n=1 Tax=Subsaxibacter sp. CAU 1640 TaxID=2933271 RepID=UPI00200344DD|nr:hypothetical protein [Subsaxibacter sp. CAU 1640]MCK7591705.1 hypothetical protein [Subsaxibacter sp. CAU 1640]